MLWALFVLLDLARVTPDDEPGQIVMPETRLSGEGGGGRTERPAGDMCRKRHPPSS